MASVREKYARIVRDVVLDHARFKPYHGEIDVEAIIDDEKGHYQILHVGWQGKRRVHGTPLHIDLIGDKVWIQYDGTSSGVASELVEAGIPRESIVLGFKPVSVRPHTGYAVN
ncbi:MAG TPA: XisI protein [Thermoanaerobaculia bacterium]|jgi:hypothetical protein